MTDTTTDTRARLLKLWQRFPETRPTTDEAWRYVKPDDLNDEDLDVVAMHLLRAMVEQGRREIEEGWQTTSELYAGVRAILLRLLQRHEIADLDALISAWYAKEGASEE